MLGCPKVNESASYFVKFPFHIEVPFEFKSLCFFLFLLESSFLLKTFSFSLLGLELSLGGLLLLLGVLLCLLWRFHWFGFSLFMDCPLLPLNISEGGGPQLLKEGMILNVDLHFLIGGQIFNHRGDLQPAYFKGRHEYLKYNVLVDIVLQHRRGRTKFFNLNRLEIDMVL